MGKHTHIYTYTYICSLAPSLVHLLIPLSVAHSSLRVTEWVFLLDLCVYACMCVFVYFCLLFILSRFEKCKPRARSIQRIGWINAENTALFRFFVGVARTSNAWPVSFPFFYHHHIHWELFLLFFHHLMCWFFISRSLSIIQHEYTYIDWHRNKDFRNIIKWNKKKCACKFFHSIFFLI